MTVIDGPYRTFEIENGVQVPFYIVPFDEQGRCQAPLTRDNLTTTLQGGAYTDVFFFSHGWNTDWAGASSTYDTFLRGYMNMRSQHGLAYARPVRPLLVGIFWPSITLVMPWEAGPAFAGVTGNNPQVSDVQAGQEHLDIQSIAAMLAEGDVERFYELAQKAQGLSESEALELAKLLAPLYLSSKKDELPAIGDIPSPGNIVQMWRDIAHMAPANPGGNFGFARNETGTAPQAAGGFNLGALLDPRLIIRLATVLQMKDRAGTVGALGVGPLLQSLLAQNQEANFHLIGHSYGCKVMLSAMCYRPLPRQVRSLLLLQPAISFLCFAKDATGQGQAGGYRGALDDVQLPIMTTFSAQDAPLHDFFHLAVRRPSDLGEIKIAGVPPSRYAALGGYGPGGCDDDCKVVVIKSIGDGYDFGPNRPRIYALNGDASIHGHNDFINDYAWWALYEQVVNES